MRLIVGNWIGGMIPKRLFTRMSDEQREQQRDEAQEVVAADDVAGQAVAHEAVDTLGDPLALARDDGPLAGGEHQERGDEQDGEAQHDHGARDRPVTVADERLVELLRRGGLEATALATVGEPGCWHPARSDSRVLLERFGRTVPRGSGSPGLRSHGASRQQPTRGSHCVPYRNHMRYSDRAIPPTIPTATSHVVPSQESSPQPMRPNIAGPVIEVRDDVPHARLVEPLVSGVGLLQRGLGWCAGWCAALACPRWRAGCRLGRALLRLVRRGLVGVAGHGGLLACS